MRLDCGVCVVRSYRHEDAEPLARHANNPTVARYMRDTFPFPYTIQHAREWISFCMDIDHEETHFAVECDREAVGGIGYRRLMDEHRFSADFGYWLGEAAWGRGIATAAVRGLISWIWEETDLHRLQSRVYEPNVASRRVLEKSGFAYEGTLRHDIFKNGEFLDTLTFAQLRPA